MKKLKIFILLICLFVPACLVGCENFNKNSLSAPTNITVENGVVSFDAVNDAEYYIININGLEFTLDAKYSNNVTIVDNKINYNANKLFTIGESYAIKIKAVADEKEDSSYSTVVSYNHTQLISKPENIKINGTTLTWDVVKNASFYLVKITTPYTSVIYDASGNKLTGDDSETIAKAELTAYSFSANTFNFNSILTQAGNYNFYIQAVYSDGSNYNESGYSNKTTYTHYVTLNTPTNGEIVNINGELYLNSVIDENANAVTIWCNGTERNVELNGSNSSISKSNNILTINLTTLFSDIDFSIIKKYEFKVKNNYLTANAENRFYLDSEYSSSVVYEQTATLTAPSITLSENELNNCHEVSWSYSDLTNVSKFKVFVATDSEIKTYTLDKNISSMLLDFDFYAVFVQAIGSGNYLSSSFSNIETINAATELTGFTITSSSSRITWNNVTNIPNAFYLINFNNESFVTSSNYYNVDTSALSSNSTPFSVTILAKGCVPNTQSLNFEYNPKLASPTIAYNQGFVSSNPYLLTFTGVENALGYYVYIKAEGEADYHQIDILYTSTSIDLTQYIIAEDGNSTYSVKVKAVADENGIYLDSDYSTIATVSHTRVLSTPANLNVVKTTSGDSSTYTLSFTGVQDAQSYEILINYNKITITSEAGVSTYSKDITKYLTTANNYEIKVRAIPSSSATNVLASEYSVINYVVYKQLAQVQNINVTESNGNYTLSFNPVENARSYRVRVVKLADNTYADYLASLNPALSTSFEINQATDVTAYVQQAGEYYFYITALAAENGYYGDSDESSTYGVVNKLTSLNAPQNLTLNNLNEATFTLSWQGDSCADYYLINITNPNGFKYEITSYTESVNINSYITLQGNYNIEVYSMITPNSENSKLYISSASTDITETYTLTKEHDFKRHQIYIYGGNYNYYIENVEQLKNVLWYNYLYEIDSVLELPIYIAYTDNEDSSTNDLREFLISLGEAASSESLNYFTQDEANEWQELTANSAKTNSELLKYLTEKLLGLYPELNILENLNISADQNDSHIFKIYYKNSLNVEKQVNTLTLAPTDYGNKFTYLEEYLRRSETTSYAIDAREGMPVETTEQLLHAVENGKKPLFYGDCETAQTVYLNAQAILRSIITTNMSDVEKATRIFDWLSYAYNINFYADKTLSGSNIVSADISTYGLRQEYYLEGIFFNIRNEANGNFDNEFYLGGQVATSSSLSKAFSLLCAIEGIQAISVNGTYTLNEATYDHNWNKVYISTTSNSTEKAWYAVDIALSETKIVTYNLSQSYSTSAHTYFLVTEAFLNNQFAPQENTAVISQTYASYTASTYYNYYANATFGLTASEINAVADVSGAGSTFKYSKLYCADTSIIEYQKYRTDIVGDYGNQQAYMQNIVMYASHMLNSNSQGICSFDFSFVNSNLGSNFENEYAKFETIISKFNQFAYNSISNTKINVETIYYSNSEGNYSYATVIVTFEKA